MFEDVKSEEWKVRILFKFLSDDHSTESVVKEAFDPELTAALPNERLSAAGGPCLLAEQAWTVPSCPF